MQHVQQPIVNACMSACISMITGIEVSRVISEFHAGYHSRRIGQEHLVYKYLIKNGFVPFDEHDLPRSKEDTEITFTPEYHYIVGAPQLVCEGVYHAVVIYFKDGELEVFDPMYGKGKSYCFGVYANNDDLIS